MPVSRREIPATTAVQLTRTARTRSPGSQGSAPPAGRGPRRHLRLADNRAARLRWPQGPRRRDELTTAQRTDIRAGPHERKVATSGSPWAPDRDTCIAVVAVIVSDYRHADEIVPERQLELMVAPLPLRSIPRPPVCVHVQDPGSAMCRRAKVRNRAPRARVSGRAVQLCTARGPSAPAIFARGSRGLMPSFRPGSGACRSSAA
jgi:hypothetical protein